jgi:hypothetical protein
MEFARQSASFEVDEKREGTSGDEDQAVHGSNVSL